MKEVFFSVKLKKSPGCDKISFNVIKKCFGSLHRLFPHIFNVSFQNGAFPDELKFARVTPLFKNRRDSDLGNQKFIFYSVFQKTL